MGCRWVSTIQYYRLGTTYLSLLDCTTCHPRDRSLMAEQSNSSSDQSQSRDDHDDSGPNSVPDVIDHEEEVTDTSSEAKVC